MNSYLNISYLIFLFVIFPVRFQQPVTLVLKNDKPVPDHVLKLLNEWKDKLSSNGINVELVATGSLVIWTRMSKELFQSKELFLNQLKLFLQHFFQNSKLEISEFEIDVKVQISKEETYGKFIIINYSNC